CCWRSSDARSAPGKLCGAPGILTGPSREGGSMSDGESPTPSPRKRPSYGLPGPSGPSADPGLPAQPEPGAQWAQDRPEPFGAFSGPSFGSSAGSPAGPAPSPPAPRPAQRGLLPVILGVLRPA